MEQTDENRNIRESTVMTDPRKLERAMDDAMAEFEVLQKAADEAWGRFVALKDEHDAATADGTPLPEPPA